MAVTIYAFGDSHARYAFHACADVTLHWLGPWTMHRVGRGGAAIVLDVADPGDGDTLIYMFGEIDVRYHLVRIARERYVDISGLVEELSTRYLDAIRGTLARMRGTPRICILGVVAPMDPLLPNSALPVIGSFHDRRATREMLNRALATKCRERGFTYVAIPMRYETAEGMLRAALSDGHAHIAMDHAHHLCRAIGRATGARLGHRRPSFVARVLRQRARVRAVQRGDGMALWRLGDAV